MRRGRIDGCFTGIYDFPIRGGPYEGPIRDPDIGCFPDPDRRGPFGSFW